MTDTNDSAQFPRPTRRAALRCGGAVVGSGLLAGCAATGSESSADGTDSDADPQSTAETVAADDYPTVDRWLETNEVGGVDDTYDRTLLDLRGVDNPRITVGAEGNGGPVAFEPSAALISPGAVVEWVWTAHGHHNVVANPETQLGVSDYSFRSGDPVEQENTLHTEQFEDTGTVLYQCKPHLQLGMKGALVVDGGP